jgi:phosphoglycolate phosphatase-like HAD superfamily hydrolase
MATRETSPLLVLWDIDHTLIETNGVGTELYRQAFEAIVGRAVEHDVEITGRTEQAIFAEALRLHSIEASQRLGESATRPSWPRSMRNTRTN